MWLRLIVSKSALLGLLTEIENPVYVDISRNRSDHIANAKQDEKQEKISRKLTIGEMIMARTIYKDSIDYIRVRIHDFPYWAQFPGVPMRTPNDRDIYTRPAANDRGYKADYSLVFRGQQARYDFIHELAHIWQNQNGVLKQKAAVFTENIRTFFQYQKAYEYKLDESNDLLDYSMEQQAAIIEDYFRLQDGGGIPKYTPSIEKSPKTKADYQKVLRKFLENPKYPRALRRQQFQQSIRGSLQENR